MTESKGEIFALIIIGVGILYLMGRFMMGGNQ
jgi:hypothetical protein